MMIECRVNLLLLSLQLYKPLKSTDTLSLSKVFSADDVEDLLAAISPGLESGEPSVRSRSGMPYAARNALATCPELARLWRHPLLVELVREVLGPKRRADSSALSRQTTG